MDNPGGLYGKVQPENFPHVNDYRNPVIAEAMKVLGYVNRFNRGISMVQEQLEANKNGLALFDFKDITTFKVTVMSADPKSEGAESGAENGAETKRNTSDKQLVVGNEHNDHLSLGAESGAENIGLGTDDTDRDTKNDTDKLTPREAEIILLIKNENSISRKRIAQKLGVGTTTVYRCIESLKDKGIIERIGGDRGGYWKIK